MKFTDSRVKAFKPKSERYVNWEDGGLGVRVSPKGTKTWISMYRFNGKPRMITHGRYPGISLSKARTLHTDAMDQVELKEDPGQKKVIENIEARTAPTFADLADEYINHRDTKKKRSAAEERRVISTDLLPAWADVRLKDITRRDVVHLLDGIVDRGAPVQANRTKSLILTMFKFGVDRGLMDDLPFNYIRKPGGQEQERERALSDDEIRIFWTRLDDAKTMTPAFKIAFRILLLTAARRGELAKARIDDIDFQDAVWSIPAEHSKNGRAHQIPMTDSVVILMRKLVKDARERKSSCLLPSPIGDKPIAERSLTRALNRAQDVFEFDEPFVVHDLRRTAMTGLGRVKDARGQPVPDVVKDHILNHLRPKMERAYDKHPYLDEMRSALQLWADHIRKLATSGTVVPMRASDV